MPTIELDLSCLSDVTTPWFLWVYSIRSRIMVFGSGRCLNVYSYSPKYYLVLEDVEYLKSSTLFSGSHIRVELHSNQGVHVFLSEDREYNVRCGSVKLRKAVEFDE
jgi:hypothetical protein